MKKYLIITRMKNRIFTTTCLAITFIGMAGCCSIEQKSKEGQDILLSSQIQLALIDTSFFQSAIAVPLETNDSSFIQDINRICLSNDTLFILNSERFRLTV